MIQLPGEFAYFVRDDKDMTAVAVALQNIDGAFKDEEEVNVAITDMIKIRAAVETAGLAIFLDSLDHLRRQFWKCLRRPVIRVGRHRAVVARNIFGRTRGTHQMKR